MRNKIDYGIYLGLEYACMCRMERGVPVIKKIEVTDDTIPCCVFFNRRGGTIVGSSAYRSMKSDRRSETKSWKIEETNTFMGFQRTMGTNKIYHSKNMEAKGLKADYTSEELSAEILRALKSFVTDEIFNSVVITVPAKFTVIQKTATERAAKLAGFEYCELIEEPIAVSLAYGMSSIQENGCWMVYDFNGDSFSVSLLKAEDGIIRLLDTELDYQLSGKDLDYAIVEKIIIPYLKENYAVESILADDKRKEGLRDAMKTYAEDLKNRLSFQEKEDIISNLGELGEDEEGEEIELDLTVTQEQAFNAMCPIFQKTVDICKNLLGRNGMNGSQLKKIILAGSSTRSPLLHQMLSEQITKNVDKSKDPITIFASGAALFASTLDADVKSSDVEIGTIRLNVGYEATSVETTEWMSIQLDKAATGANCPNKVFVELVSSDKTWSSGKTEIDANGNVVEAHLQEGKANTFSIMTYDEQGTALDCSPNEITIIQDSKVGAAPLPYYIGIEIWDEDKKKLVFQPIEGLEKGNPLPAVGILNNIRTTTLIRSGNPKDTFVLPVYQADEYYAGTSSKLYEYVADIVIDGSDVPLLIPVDSCVDLKIKTDSSETMTVEAYFPSMDLTIAKELKTNKKQSLEDARKRIKENYSEAERILVSLEKQGVDTTDLRSRLQEVRTEGSNNKETKMVLQHQKEVLREIEKRNSESEFDRIVKMMINEFKKAEYEQEEYGSFASGQLLFELHSSMNHSIEMRDVCRCKHILNQLNEFRTALTKKQF